MRTSPSVRALTLLVAMLVASTPLPLLVAGPAWLALVATAAAGIIVPGIALRALRCPSPLVPVGQVLGGAVAIVGTELRTGTLSLHGPLELFTRQGSVIGEGITELGGATPPVALQGPGMTLLVLILSLVALTLDLLAVDLDRPGPAGLLLVLFALVPALMVPDGGPWWTVAGPVAGGLLLWVLPALASVRGVAVAAVALVAVLGLGPLLAPVVPYGEDPPLTLTVQTLHDWTGRGDLATSAMVDDSVSVRRDLLRGRPREVLSFTADAPEPDYLRLRTLTHYRDGVWEGEEGDGQSATASPTDRRTAAEPVAGGPRYDVSIGDLTADTLPAPGSVRWTDTGDLALSGQTDTLGELRLRDGTRALGGVSYSVQSAAGAPSVEQLRAVPDGALAGPLEDGTIDAAVPPAVAQLAQQVRTDADARTAYDTARAFEDFFHANFDYDLRARTPAGQDPVASFLADRTGYCEQFAATFALMMVAQGYPTRVATGFTAGAAEGARRVVTTDNAHAWPEVWFGADIGWVRFEPTPAAAANGVSDPAYTAAPTAATPEAATPPAPTSAAPATPAPASSAPSASSAAPTTSARGATAAARPGDPGVGGAAVLAVLAAAILVGALVLLARGAARRRDARWERALAGAAPEREAALLAWSELGTTVHRRARADHAFARLRAGRRRAAPAFLSLDRTLPPREALRALVDTAHTQGRGARDGVAAEDEAAAARLGDAVARARYAPADASGGIEAARRVREDLERVRALVRRRPRRR